jgi:hypothetical protein
MSENMIAVEEEIVEGGTAVSSSSVLAVSPGATSRRLMMASIGAVVVVGGAVKSRVSGFMESAELETAAEQPPQQRRLWNPIDSLLTRLNVPTKTDIDALNDQVSALLTKIEALQELEQRPLPTPSDIIHEEMEEVGG